ncbi:hypothetical protein IFO70_20340 [Phormidium tenue FACHB-886]|nr:hypothetical protein [Phormidium tenue FACHB-886]
MKNTPTVFPTEHLPTPLSFRSNLAEAATLCVYQMSNLMQILHYQPHRLRDRPDS